ncbi:non-ribosomal peptide synthetase [Derxia lacustris]|uniref:non-ribosomal peptide synthetase n=1 Tax=Derxia lacustris TaxID=764842 RepID=UPI000A16FECE|nr:non-ribosomal peptide synthetase [Derxia lacustris]
MTAPSSAGPAPRNFVSQLRTLAATRPDDRALVIVAERDGQPHDTPIGYAALDRRVRALAARLQSGFAPGERALLLLDNDDHYVVAFLACLYAGLIAVPVFPPESGRPQHMARLLGIAADAEARCLLTTRALLDLIGGTVEGFAGAAVVAVDATDPTRADDWQPREPGADDLAFLQYTSGSTAAPKGVMVSHGNLMANERAIEAGLAVGADDVFVSWLPLYHDMGLIGGLLQPLHRGIPVGLMTPRFFLERPARWLEAIARLRGSISGGPDFAYRLCVERVRPAQIAALDLSCWRLAFSGAEPVRHDSLAAFVAHLAPSGFDARAVYPCYGLAEATLFVTGGRRGAGLDARRFAATALAAGAAIESADPADRPLVACGAPAPEHAVAIVDPVSHAARPEGQVGEICAAGPSIAGGYWRRAEASARTFVERDGRRWLHTGDLGFLHRGQLYITGRAKDLIILRGQNIYPQDIERAVEDEVEAVRKGRVAAFAVTQPDGIEGVGLAAEVSRGLQRLVPVDTLVEALSRSAGTVCREPPALLLLLNPGALPRTSSGKLQRNACREGWLAGTLDSYATVEFGQRRAPPADAQAERAAPAAPTAVATDDDAGELAALWRAALRRADAALGNTHFFAAGGDSLAAVELAAGIGARWKLDFPVRRVLAAPCFDELLADLRAARAGAAPLAGIPVLAAERRAGPLALSHAQERQWFLWRLDPANPAYHVGGALDLDGRLEVGALRAALAALVARHESLRTVFRPVADGSAAQFVLPPAPVALPVLDLRALPDADRAAEARRSARALVDAGFDLAQGPLLRALLLRLADDRHRLVVVLHHIVCDGASMQLFVDELADGYAARLAGRAPARAPLAVQYADYAAWQRARLAAGLAERELAWWRAQLGTVHPVLALPTDRPRAATGARHAARHAVALDPARVARLRQCARDGDCTLFMLLLAGFQLLLARETGARELRIGVPVANREHPDTHGLIGYFVNLLVLRGRIDPRMTLAELLAATRRATLEAQAHQELPFEQLVDALQVERSLSHAPLVQVVFNHLRHDLARQPLPGVVMTRHRLDDPAPQYELVLDAVEDGAGGLGLDLAYAADLFEPARIAALAARYLRLLDAFATRPATPVGALDLLDTDDHARLVYWSRAAPEPFDPAPVHELIARQAHANPAARALVFGDRVVTRGQLDRRANALAHRLRALGIGPERRVGVLLERGPELVVALLAVLKAGGAYLPLDPAAPAARLAATLDDGAVALLVSTGALCKGLQAGAETRRPLLDLDALDLDLDLDAGPPAGALHDASLAYVIHTSGSTGRPKGVAVAHGPLSRHCQATARLYEMDADSLELHFLSFSFDGAHERLFATLGCGAALLLKDAALWPPEHMLDMIERHGVSHLALPPAYLVQLAACARATGRRPPLRGIAFGGEAMPREGFEQVRAALRPRWLVNGYGPTETVVTPMLWKVSADTPCPSAQAPIGRPVGERRAHVLDADLLPVAPGVAGELYLGGAGLARGYLGRPGLTAERFVADPFSASGGRLYRTGDRVRWRSDGQLEFLGRIDQQLKLRGFRIEPAEIEARLLALPGIAAAVVLARADGPGGAVRLVAYVAGSGPERPDPRALRRALADSLPDYMVPAAFVVLDALPVNTAGKLDRSALPAPEAPAEADRVAPVGDLEERLAALWSLTLGVDSIGRHDNFFELGGHSLLLLELHRRIQTLLGSSLPVSDLFRFPTVATLAAHLAGAVGAETAAAERAAARAQRQRATFLPRKPAIDRTPT